MFNYLTILNNTGRSYRYDRYLFSNKIDYIRNTHIDNAVHGYTETKLLTNVKTLRTNCYNCNLKT